VAVVRATPAAAPAAASWRYHPRQPSRMQASVALGDGRRLYAGVRGERWVDDPARGVLEAAVPAPEELVAILDAPGAARWFVGRSGTTYSALTPLGPFVEAVAPFDPVARVAGAGGLVVAVGLDRKLSRSTDRGRTWIPAGPPGKSFVDVAVDASGNALALASPEALWFSTDGGAEFRLLERDPFGVLRLETNRGGDGIDVVGVLGRSRWVPPSSGLADVADKPAELLKSAGRAPLGADAGALSEGRADLGEGGYLEARLSDESKRAFELVTGPLAGPLARSPLERANGCTAVRVASFERTVYLACFRSSPAASQPVELSVSDDRGKTFRPAPPRFFAKVADFRMAVGASGGLLLTGACQPSTEGPGCAPSGILKRRVVPPPKDAPAAAPKPPGQRATITQAYELAVSASPTLAENALDLRFDADGKTLFAVGVSSKASNLALFVSNDEGRTFEPRDLGETGAEATDDQARIGMLSPGVDGTMALVLRGPRGTSSLLVFDGRGSLLRAGSPPERALLGGAGLSALALGVESGAVWESLDGGASWQDRGRAPLQLCPGDAACDVPVLCSSGGCVVGDELTRVGWGAPDASELETAGPIERAPVGVERRLKTPIGCVLGAAPWRTLAGVTELPDAKSAALGDAAWFAVAPDPEAATAVVYHALPGARARVEQVSLLPPARNPSGLAFAALPQVEGLAILRYRVPDGRTKSTRITDVEVAWDNLLEGRVVRQRVQDVGDYVPGDYERGNGRVQSARPDLLSIGERGLYLRLHGKVRERQPTLFLDGTRVTQIPPIVWPAGVARDHIEMAHLGAEHVGLAIVGRGRAAVRARQEGQDFTFQAAAVGLPDPEAFGQLVDVKITYLGGQAALHVEEADHLAESSTARVLPLRASGAVIDPPRSAPTQADLPPLPLPCSLDTKRASARVIARLFPGARHPVVVTDTVEPPRGMITGEAVLFGSAEAPCAAAFEVLPVTGSGTEPPPAERGILLLDDLEHAWMIRQSREPAVERTGVEYRMMTCRFEPSLEVPEEIQRSPEALAPRR
jgi:hypothetical protein